MANKNPILEEAHEVYFQGGRILKRLCKASVKGLTRFADALSVLSDEDLDMLALECERLARLRVEEFEKVSSEE
jgi:hypothetical protein